MQTLYISKIQLRERDNIDYSKQNNLHFKQSVDYSVYPFCIPAIKNFENIELNKPVTFFVGENGIGKSTLLEAIAVEYGFNPEGGTKNFNFSTSSTHSELHNYLKLIKGVIRAKDGFFLRAESFYNVATEIEKLDEAGGFGAPIINSYGGKSLHHQSHGESFMALLTHRFGGNGLYVLDEPEAALSPSRQLGMLARINDLVKLNSQFIIATHSPILLAYPNADIYVLSNDGMTLTPYKETDHYLISKQFLNNPEGVLRHLLEE